MSNITQLTLGGFQTIKHVSLIDLAPITLLFGPNSSGKSSIQDALDLARDLYTLPSLRFHEVESERIFQMGHLYRLDGVDFEETPIGKNWRRIAPHRGDVESFDGDMTFGATFLVGAEDIIPRAHEKGSDFDFYLKEDQELVECRLLSRFWLKNYGDHEGYDDGVYLHRDFSLEIEGKIFAYKEGEGDFKVNLSHPSVSYIGSRDSLLWRHERYSDECVAFTQGEWLVFQKTNIVHINQWLKLWHGWSNEDFIPESDHPANNVRQYYNTLIERIMRTASSTFNHVEASRKLPSNADLSFSFTGDPDRQMPSWWSSGEKQKSLVNTYGFERTASTEYESLAFSCALSIPEYTNTPSLVHTDGDYQNLLVEVNRFLSDYLFIERGYQVRFKAAVAMELESYRETFSSLGDECYLWPHELFIRMYLEDSNGLELDFSEVGSGLGYVLPVLVASASGAAALIQQPELHLHPALQAAIADVFIDSAQSKRLTVIETHSEHLLLRFLKRIRLQNSQLCVECGLTAEQLAIYYFDSDPSGTTSVVRIRVSDDGDFLDPWPRGFFEERARELFDE